MARPFKTIPTSRANPAPKITKAGPQPAFPVSTHPDYRTKPNPPPQTIPAQTISPSRPYIRRAHYSPYHAPAQPGRTRARRRRSTITGSPTPINAPKNRFKALWRPPNPDWHQPLTRDSKNRLIGHRRPGPTGTVPGIQNRSQKPSLCQYLARICQPSA